MRAKRLLFSGLAVGLFAFILVLAGKPAPVQAETPVQFDDPVAQGEYLSYIAGCQGCHSSRDEGSVPMSGGRTFRLGSAGSVYGRNLTPDPETGLGTWTDEEIKAAIQTGVSKDGHALFPLMPFDLYNHMAESDLDALVAYLRSLPPVVNEYAHDEASHILPTSGAQPLERHTDIVAPDPTDTVARGEYLFGNVLVCTTCHTPDDPNTQQPDPTMYLAGGQPYEGNWGIVYAGNITPDDETGIGGWTDAQIKQVLRAGVLPNGRRVVLMPWAAVSHLTEADTDAVVSFLRDEVDPVNNVVPSATLNDEYIQIVELPAEDQPTAGTGIFSMPVIIIATVLVVVVGFVIGIVFNNRNAKKPEDTPPTPPAASAPPATGE